MSYQNPEDVEVQPLGGQPELEAVIGLLRDLGLGGHPPVLRPTHTHMFRQLSHLSRKQA